MKAHRGLLTEHSKTSKHVKTAKLFSSRRQLTLLQYHKDSTYSFETAVTEVKMLLFVICHSTIRSIDHLNALINPIFKDKMNQIKVHRSKTTGILKNIASNFRSDLRKDISDSFIAF